MSGELAEGLLARATHSQQQRVTPRELSVRNDDSYRGNVPRIVPKSRRE